MNTQREARRIRLSETRASWEDQGSCEVAAGKLEVMEKFFTPLPHSTGHRVAKDRTKGEASWEGIRDKYYKESISSSRSTSSSPWSSESNFGVRARFSRYPAHVAHSRSCNDLSVVKGRVNEEKKDFTVKQKNASHMRKVNREGTEQLSPGICIAGSIKKNHSGHVRDVVHNSKGGREDKRTLTNVGRRAKSMEALAEKETRKKQGNGRRVIEDKQKFSRFLDEITVQVLSPSNLNSLGVKERQSADNREQWKNSSTDSSGSRGKRSQHNSALEQQEVRRKGKGKSVSATRAKETPGPRRSREMSTSPDSVSSSNWQRGEREDTNLSASATNHQSRRTSRRLSQEREMKGGNLFEQMGMEKKQVVLSGGGVLKGKTQYTDKVQSSKHASDSITKVPVTPTPAWWGETGGPIFSQHSEKNMENLTDPSRRMKDTFSGTQSTNQMQEGALQSSTQSEHLEEDKDFLNQKITALLDHLVQAQSTICALEKLNVSSLLRHLPADMLESMKVTHQGPDASIQIEDTQDFKSSSAFSSQTSHLDICSGDLKYTREESQHAPQLTAFTPCSPRKQRSFPALHTLYTSTESECSLEDMLPTCKLLSPRFPNLGESFSDDRKEDGNSDGSYTRTEQKTSSQPLPSLLPTHRIPHHSHHSRASSSESSGDDPLINWGEMPSQEPPLDYISAQKILDTLLGLTTSSDRMNILKPENMGEFPLGYIPKIGSHIMRRDFQLLNNPISVVPKIDSKRMSYAVMNKDYLHPSQPENSLCSSHSPLHSPADDTNRRLNPTESKIPPLPAKRISFPGNFTNTCPPLSPVGEVGFRPVGKNESLTYNKSECLQPPNHLPTPGNPAVSPSHHSIPFVLRSPSGSELVMGSWEGQNHHQEGARERKPRKERTVTFHTMINEGQPNQGQVTVRSKFMSSRVEDQGQGENASVDSTLL